jgi:hypothetical protein
MQLNLDLESKTLRLQSHLESSLVHSELSDQLLLLQNELFSCKQSVDQLATRNNLLLDQLSDEQNLK